MKRIISSAAAAVLSLCMTAGAFAATSSVSVKNNNTSMKPVTYTYSENSGQTVKSVKTLMTALSDLSKKTTVTQKLTITSESENPTEMSLRLELPEKTDVKPEPAAATPSPDEYNALEYYNIKITDAEDNIVYDSENVKDDDKSEKKLYKDIPLGVFNNNDVSDSRTYDVAVSINKDVNTKSVAQNAQRLDWCVVSEPVAEEATPAPTVAVTSAPVSETTVPTAAPTEKPADPSDGVKTDKNGVVTLSKGEYLCGKDIEDGRYTMTGDGKVDVYTSEGVLKTTIVLKDKNDKSSNGVNEYIINLLDGEKIKVESDTKFTPYSASATSKPSSATSKPSATKTPSSSSKTNPKTGDRMPLAALGAVCLLAVGAFVILEIKKRNS